MVAPRWYPSKIDAWLAALLAVPPLAAVWVLAEAMVRGGGTELWIAVAMTLLVAGLYVGVVVPVRYGVDDQHLIVRSGLCRLRIPLAEIVEVRPTWNPLSAPALSLDRLQVQYGPGAVRSVRISPADRDRFLDDLAHAAGLDRDGDRLLRASAA